MCQRKENHKNRNEYIYSTKPINISEKFDKQCEALQATVRDNNFITSYLCVLIKMAAMDEEISLHISSGI